MASSGSPRSIALLVGEHDPLAPARGSWAPLRHAGRTVGSALRTRDEVAPVYVSVGHRISLASARRWVLRLAPDVRLTEPIRAAHAASNRARRAP